MNDIADMDPHAQLEGMVIGEVSLRLDGALDGIDHARKFHQPAITHALDHVAPMGGDDGLERFLAQLAKRRQRAGLVLFHQAGIAGHVGGHDGGKSALHRKSPCHGRQTIHDNRNTDYAIATGVRHPASAPYLGRFRGLDGLPDAVGG